jgi:hypothetical protein
MVRQRADGLNLAVLLNGSRNRFQNDNENPRQAIDAALDGPAALDWEAFAAV